MQKLLLYIVVSLSPAMLATRFLLNTMQMVKCHKNNVNRCKEVAYPQSEVGHLTKSVDYLTKSGGQITKSWVYEPHASFTSKQCWKFDCSKMPWTATWTNNSTHLMSKKRAKRYTIKRTKVYSHLIQTKAYLLTFQCAKPPLGTCFKEELQRRSVGHVLSKIRTQCILMTGQGLYLCASTARTIVTHQSQPRSGSFEPRRRPERRREKVSRSSWLQIFFRRWTVAAAVAAF